MALKFKNEKPPRPPGTRTVNVLSRIVRERRKDVAAAKRVATMRDLLWAAERRQHHSLIERLNKAPAPRIIAEVKQRSPSGGLIREDYDPAAVALEYEAAGAVGISVLTESRHFGGSEADLRAVRAAVGLPVLRKDFIVDSYQLAETAAWGADVVLLIVAALDPGLCRVLYEECMELGLDVIVEVHTLDELTTALGCSKAIIGVNSRNLKTLKTDLGVAREIVAALPGNRLCIAESGIKNAADARMLLAAGYDGFLIGESLLRAPSPGRALVEMMRGIRQQGRRE